LQESGKSIDKPEIEESFGESAVVLAEVFRSDLHIYLSFDFFYLIAGECEFNWKANSREEKGFAGENKRSC